MIPNSKVERYDALIDDLMDDCRWLIRQYESRLEGYENALKWHSHQYDKGRLHGMMEVTREMLTEARHYLEILEEDKEDE